MFESHEYAWHNLIQSDDDEETKRFSEENLVH